MYGKVGRLRCRGLSGNAGWRAAVDRVCASSRVSRLGFDVQFSQSPKFQSPPRVESVRRLKEPITAADTRSSRSASGDSGGAFSCDDLYLRKMAEDQLLSFRASYRNVDMTYSFPARALTPPARRSAGAPADCENAEIRFEISLGGQPSCRNVSFTWLTASLLTKCSKFRNRPGEAEICVELSLPVV